MLGPAKLGPHQAK